MKKYLQSILLAGAVLGAAETASAHRIWILPSTFTLSGEEQWVTVDGAISNDLFFPNHVAMSLDNITVTAPDGAEAPKENGARGKFRSTFDVKLDKEGTYRVTEKAATYFARWQEDGEEQRARASLDELLSKGLAEKEGAAFMVARRRVETFVTLGAPTSDVFSPIGEGVELVPTTHPNDVYAGEDITFSFLLDGVPAKDMEVLIVKGHDRYRDAQNEIKVTTDENGTIVFSVAEPGRYWLSTFTVAGKAQEQGIDMARRVSYTVTFEALPN